jgi:hypothetical protein
MRQLPQSLFDIYALALPRGHGFGNRPPVEAWESEDGLPLGVVTHDESDGNFGLLVLRRRVNHVLAVICRENGLPDLIGARAREKSVMNEGALPGGK